MITRNGIDVVIRCSFCAVDYDTGMPSYNMALWHLKERGWIVRSDRDDWTAEPTFICDECKDTDAARDVSGWLVYCNTCDDEDWVDSKAEAKEWRDGHDCTWDCRYQGPDVTIEGPQEREERDELIREMREIAHRDQQQAAAREERHIETAHLASKVEKARESRWRRLLLRMAGV